MNEWIDWLVDGLSWCVKSTALSDGAFSPLTAFFAFCDGCSHRLSCFSSRFSVFGQKKMLASFVACRFQSILGLGTMDG